MAGPKAPRAQDWFDASGKPTTAFVRYLENIEQLGDLDALSEQIAALEEAEVTRDDLAAGFGSIILQHGYFENGTYANLGSSAPSTSVDNNVPVATEGYQFWSESITPKSASSTFYLTASVKAISAASSVTGFFLNTDSSNALSSQLLSGAGGAHLMRIASWGTSAKTFSYRIGASGISDVHLNGITTGGLFGGTNFSNVQWHEIQNY